MMIMIIAIAHFVPPPSLLHTLFFFFVYCSFDASLYTLDVINVAWNIFVGSLHLYVHRLNRCVPHHHHHHHHTAHRWTLWNILCWMCIYFSYFFLFLFLYIYMQIFTLFHCPSLICEVCTCVHSFYMGSCVRLTTRPLFILLAFQVQKEN